MTITQLRGDTVQVIKITKLSRVFYFFINLDVHIASLQNSFNLEMKNVKSDDTGKKLL